MKSILCNTVLAAAGLIACVLPGLTLAQDGASQSRNPSARDMRFEGVWAKPGSVTLIKQFAKHLVLQGKDEASVWSAKCVLGGGQAVCRGSGLTVTGFEFTYESVISIEPQGLRDVWRAAFPDTQDLTGNDLLLSIALPAFDASIKPAK